MDGNTGGLDFNGCRFASCSFLYGFPRIVFRTGGGDRNLAAFWAIRKGEEEHAGVLNIWVFQRGLGVFCFHRPGD